MAQLKGLQFVYDSRGRRTKALVDLTQHGAEFAAFLQAVQKKQASAQASYTGTSMFGNSSGSSSNSRSTKLQKLLNVAKSYLGTPYRTGGTTKSGMDCSGYTMTCFKEALSVSIPRVSRDQTTAGTAIAYADIQAGDLMFFATGTPGRINHVGIASRIENGVVYFLHASSSRGIMETNMSLDYWKKAYMTARNVF